MGCALKSWITPTSVGSEGCRGPISPTRKRCQFSVAARELAGFGSSLFYDGGLQGLNLLTLHCRLLIKRSGSPLGAGLADRELSKGNSKA